MKFTVSKLIIYKLFNLKVKTTELFHIFPRFFSHFNFSLHNLTFFFLNLYLSFSLYKFYYDQKMGPFNINLMINTSSWNTYLNLSKYCNFLTICVSYVLVFHVNVFCNCLLSCTDLCLKLDISFLFICLCMCIQWVWMCFVCVFVCDKKDGRVSIVVRG